MWAKVSRNAASSLAATAVGLGVGIVLMPFVIHHLGATAYGIWVLATSVTGYLSVLDLGLNPTLVKTSAECLARREAGAEDSLNGTVSTAVAAYVLLAALIVLLVGGLSMVAGRVFLQVPAEDLTTFRLVVFLVGLQIAVSFPMSIWNGLVAGLQDFHVLNGLGVATTLLRAALTVALLVSGLGILGLVWAGLATSTVAWLASWWWVRRRIPSLRIRPAYVSASHARGLVRFSGAMVLWSVAGYSVHHLDRVLIGFFLSPAAITPYEVGARLATYSRSILQSWLSTILPAASALSARDEEAHLRDLYLRGTKYLMASYLLVAAPLVGFGQSFVTLWMGEGFSASYWVMVLLLAGSVYQSQNVVAHVMLPGIGRLAVFTRLMATYPIVMGVLGVWLVHRWGALGAAAAVAATMIAVESAFTAPILRVFGVRPGAFVRTCHLPVARAAVAAIAWIAVAHRLLPPGSWAALCADVGICLALSAASFWLLGLSAAERAGVQRQIRRWLAPGPGMRPSEEAVAS